MIITKFETNKDKNLYFNQSIIKEKKYSPKQENQIVNIYPKIEYQEFLGIGAAITESSAYNYSLLPTNKKKGFYE